MGAECASLGVEWARMQSDVAGVAAWWTRMGFEWIRMGDELAKLGIGAKWAWMGSGLTRMGAE